MDGKERWCRPQTVCKRASPREHHEDRVSAISATSAIAPTNEKGVKSTILRTSDSDLALGALALLAQTCDKEHNGFTFSDKLEVDNLDYISRKIFDLNTDSIPKRDAMLLGAYNVLSGLMGGANFIENEDKDQNVLRSGVYNPVRRGTNYKPSAKRS